MRPYPNNCRNCSVPSTLAMSKRRKGPEIVREGSEMKQLDTLEPLLSPILTNSAHSIFPEGSTVIALFRSGTVIQLATGGFAWASNININTGLVLFRGHFVCVPSLIDDLFDSNTGNTFLLTCRNTNKIDVWSCTDGMLIYSWVASSIQIPTHIQISQEWIVIASDNAIFGTTTFICHPWKSTVLLPDFHTTVMSNVSISKVSQLVFDHDNETICWIVSASGVFSFDVTLPQSIIAPIRVVLEPLKKQWRFDDDYRSLLFKYYNITNRYHSYTTEQKLAYIKQSNQMEIEPETKSLRTYPHPSIHIENIPIHMSGQELCQQERMIFAPSFAVVINTNTKKVFSIPIPENIGAIHVNLGSFVIVTATFDAIYYHVKGGDVLTTSISLPTSSGLRHIYHNKCIIPPFSIDLDKTGKTNAIFTHNNTNKLYKIDLSRDTSQLVVNI